METIQPHTQALPPGTRIEEFVIEKVLGSGGFGITYLATDAALNRKVVIKENLPAQFCFRDPSSLTVAPRHTHGDDVDNFQWSLENFSKEASMLASLDHPGIVKVLRSFQACGTAYFVMPFVEGMPFDELIKNRQSKGQVFTEEELRGLLERVLDALAYLHDRGIYHRDIKPGNILITNEGIPVLIDFGSAREQLCERSMTVIESPGYTPFEQLQSRGNVGPWSDLYALGATLVKAITFEGIPKAADRVLDDPWKGLANHREASQRYSFDFLYSIDRSLEPMPITRWQQAKEWRDKLNGRTSDRGQSSQIQSKKTPPPLPEVNVPSGHANSLEQTKQKPELWNPTTAVNLSALFSPAFGAYLHAKNAKELGLVSEHKVNIRWFYPLAITQLLSVYLMDGKVSGFIILNTMALIAWYFSSAKKQINFVKKIHSKNYTRKSFFKPIFVLLICWFLAAAVYLLSFSYGFYNSDSNNEEKSNTSASASSQTTSEKSEKNKAIEYFNRGLKYASGDGVPKDETEAVKLYRKAAELGLAESQYNLGLCYANGQGVAKNELEAANWYRKAAELGNANAQNNLGVCYENGHGVTKDEAESARWYRKAAEQGLAVAQRNLGLSYANGSGVAEDHAEAARWYRKAAEQWNVDAIYFLGQCYAEGNGVEQNYGEAANWYRKAAEQGNADAKFNLGVFYAEGIGVHKDEEEAVRWYRKAAEQESADAQYSLGLCYADGKGVEKDRAEAMKLFRKAAEQENADAQFVLGGSYLIGQDVAQDEAEAFRWFSKSAENGNAKAQNLLGVCLDGGKGVAVDKAEAAMWYRKAAEQGLAVAQFNLGVCYANGNGVAKDLAQAAKLYHKSAEQGHAVAQGYLGACYADGIGVVKNEAEAARWYLKAAEQGIAEAQNNLGVCYYNGKGVEMDGPEAARWFRKAAEQDNARAQINLGLFYKTANNYVEAVKWFRKASDLGNAEAQMNLGLCYVYGDGVPRNYSEAINWYRKAADQGNDEAKFQLDRINREIGR